jgi:type IV secretion system protein VirB9
MKRETTLAIAVGLAVILSACTTTKDLERRPQMVAVDSSKAQEKESVVQQKTNSENPQERVGATIDGAAGKKESDTPASETEGAGGKNSTASATGAPEVQKSVAEKAAQSAGGEAQQGTLGSLSQPNATSPGEVQKPKEAASMTPAPAKEGAGAPPVIIEKKIYIEKPIYYPENAPQASPKAGDAVQNATSQGVMKPKDYNGAMILYDYDDKLVYQVFTMPLRVSDIYLEPGEKVIEQPFCGDTTRWSIGGGVSKTGGVDTQHLYLKPSEEGLETTLIINTDRRIYHLIIKSFKDTFMLAVMWRYPGFGLPYDFLTENNQKKGSSDQGKTQGENQSESSAATFGIDPALMSTDYTVSYPKNNPPEWLPTLVIDDGNKTYIVLPETVIHHELPAVFGENGEIVNFRVKDNIFVIDRLMRKMQLKLRSTTVEIKKKGA